ncbi:MAG: hypothetical protein ACXU82_10150 [Caulobacteraceae bacterium]
MLQFAVIRRGSTWAVLKNGSPVEEGLRRSDAVALAERLSFAAEEHGAVELLVQDYTGEVRTTYSGSD